MDRRTSAEGEISAAGELGLRCRNRHGTLEVNLPLFRRLARSLLTERARRERFALEVSLVGDREMTRLNEAYLGHQGSTDVITFDYGQETGDCLSGEIFICLDEARRQARRFRTRWGTEVARYFVHAVLHLLGYKDDRAVPRRLMKRIENRWVRWVEGRFALSRLVKARRLAV